MGVLVALRMDVPNFIRDVLNFIKNAQNFVNDVPRLSKCIQGGNRPPITSLWVLK